MIYQDVYSSIQAPTSMYGLRKQVEQDQLVAQQNQIAIQQKARTEQEAKAKALYQSMNQFGGLSDDKQSAMYQTYRQKWESLMPEAKGIFPSVWDSKDPTNKESLGQVISFLEPLVPAEEFTLSEGQIRYAQRPGGQPTVVARGGEKPEKSIFGEEKITLPDGSQMILDTVDLPSGSRQVGDFVKVRNKPNTKIPADQYYRENPEDWPYLGENPYSQKKPVNSLAVPPTAPMAVPGQTELPPRQFNAPSPTNRAGETNVGFPIDENAMMQQPQIMPTMGNSMLKGAGAVMADEFAPQPRNALVGGMMPQPSQFAELMPAGSTPNRFGSPGVEGIDFAATGGYKQEIVPGGMRFSGPPKPTSQSQQRATWTKMTDAQLIADKQDPKRVVGYISSDNEPKYIPIQSAAQWRKEEAEARSAEAGATKAEQEVEKKRADLVNFLIGAKEYRNILSQLEKQPGFDTGPVDTFITSKTPLGQRLISLKKLVGPQLKAAQKVAGDQLTQVEAEQQLGSLPDTETYMSNNVFQLDTLENYYLRLLGVRAAVSSQAEADALPPNTPFVDLNSVPPKLYITPPKGGYQK
jgi:hypothetical protein